MRKSESIVWPSNRDGPAAPLAKQSQIDGIGNRPATIRMEVIADIPLTRRAGVCK
jgi:hypothetical protein